MVRPAIMADAALICAMVTTSGDTVTPGSGKPLTLSGCGMGQVRFEGEEHAEKGYACEDCHPGLFSMKYGDAAMTYQPSTAVTSAAPVTLAPGPSAPRTRKSVTTSSAANLCR